jgi:hypothetical protein
MKVRKGRVSHSETRRLVKKGKPTISFHPGGLHDSLGVPMGEKIPASKMAAAMSGSKGPMAKKQAMFKKNILTGPK